jgi:uncharacterized phiE125 gp8 family phage protein
MLRLIDPPASDPISMVEAKKHLRVDYPDDDLLIQGLISAATIAAQDHVQRRFVAQTVEWICSGWGYGEIVLPIAPVSKDDVERVTYTDWSGTVRVLPEDQYVAQTHGHTVRIIPPRGVIWPMPDPRAAEPVVIRFQVGQDVEQIGANITAAIKLILGHLYENRENVISSARGVAIELPQGAAALLLGEVW